MTYEANKTATLAMAPGDYDAARAAFIADGNAFFYKGARKPMSTGSETSHAPKAPGEAPVDVSASTSSMSKTPPQANAGFHTVAGMDAPEYERHKGAYLTRVTPRPKAL